MEFSEPSQVTYLPCHSAIMRPSHKQWFDRPQSQLRKLIELLGKALNRFPRESLVAKEPFTRFILFHSRLQLLAVLLAFLSSCVVDFVVNGHVGGHFGNKPLVCVCVLCAYA